MEPDRKRFRDSWLIRAGVILFVLGSGPLLFIILIAKLGLTKDPNPNPVGFGLMAMCSFYPSIALIVAGVVAVRRQNRKEPKMSHDNFLAINEIEVIEKQIDTLCRELITVSSSLVNPTLTTNALLTLFVYIVNQWKSLTILINASSNPELEVRTANSCAAIVRIMYDAFLQFLWIAQEPNSSDALAQDYLDFNAIEHWNYIKTIVEGKNPLSQRLAASPRRASTEPALKAAYDKAKARYLDKKGQIRRQWYKGTLATIAGKVDREDEYKWYVGMSNSSIHAGAFATLNGPMLIGKESLPFMSAMIVCQAADRFVEVVNISISECSRQTIDFHKDEWLDHQH